MSLLYRGPNIGGQAAPRALDSKGAVEINCLRAISSLSARLLFDAERAEVDIAFLPARKPRAKLSFHRILPAEHATVEMLPTCPDQGRYLA